MPVHRHSGRAIVEKAFIGHSGPHPIAQGMQVLLVYVLIRAVRDATSRNPREQQRALEWLNSETGRSIAEMFGVRWGADLTADDLRSRERNVYFRGD